MMYTQNIFTPEILEALYNFNNYSKTWLIHDNLYFANDAYFQFIKNGGTGHNVKYQRLFLRLIPMQINLNYSDPWFNYYKSGINPIFAHYLNLSEIIQLLPNYQQLKVSRNEMVDLARVIQFFETTRFIESFYLNMEYRLDQYPQFWVIITPAELLLFDSKQQLLAKINFIESKISYVGRQATEYYNLITFCKSKFKKLIKQIVPEKDPYYHQQYLDFYSIRSRFKWGKTSFDPIYRFFDNIGKTNKSKITNFIRFKEEYIKKYNLNSQNKNFRFQVFSIRNPFAVKWQQRSPLVRKNITNYSKKKIKVMENLIKIQSEFKPLNTLLLFKEALTLLININNIDNDLNSSKNKYWDTGNITGGIPPRVFNFDFNKYIAWQFNSQEYYINIYNNHWKRNATKMPILSKFLKKVLFLKIDFLKKAPLGYFLKKNNKLIYWNQFIKDEVHLQNILNYIIHWDNKIYLNDIGLEKYKFYKQERQHYMQILQSAVNYYIKAFTANNSSNKINLFIQKILLLPNISLKKKLFFLKTKELELKNLCLNKKNSSIQNYNTKMIYRHFKHMLRPFNSFLAVYNDFSFSKKNLSTLEFEFINSNNQNLYRNSLLLKSYQKHYTSKLINLYKKFKTLWKKNYNIKFLKINKKSYYKLNKLVVNDFKHKHLINKNKVFTQEFDFLFVNLLELLKSVKIDVESKFENLKFDYKLLNTNDNDFFNTFTKARHRPVLNHIVENSFQNHRKKSFFSQQLYPDKWNNLNRKYLLKRNKGRLQRNRKALFFVRKWRFISNLLVNHRKRHRIGVLARFHWWSMLNSLKGRLNRGRRYPNNYADYLNWNFIKKNKEHLSSNIGTPFLQNENMRENNVDYDINSIKNHNEKKSLIFLENVWENYKKKKNFDIKEPLGEFHIGNWLPLPISFVDMMFIWKEQEKKLKKKLLKVSKNIKNSIKLDFIIINYIKSLKSNCRCKKKNICNCLNNPFLLSSLMKRKFIHKLLTEKKDNLVKKYTYLKKLNILSKRILKKADIHEQTTRLPMEYADRLQREQGVIDRFNYMLPRLEDERSKALIKPWVIRELKKIKYELYKGKLYTLPYNFLKDFNNNMNYTDYKFHFFSIKEKYLNYLKLHQLVVDKPIMWLDSDAYRIECPINFKEIAELFDLQKVQSEKVWKAYNSFLNNLTMKDKINAKDVNAMPCLQSVIKSCPCHRCTGKDFNYFHPSLLFLLKKKVEKNFYSKLNLVKHLDYISTVNEWDERSYIFNNEPLPKNLVHLIGNLNLNLTIKDNGIDNITKNNLQHWIKYEIENFQYKQHEMRLNTFKPNLKILNFIDNVRYKRPIDIYQPQFKKYLHSTFFTEAQIPYASFKMRDIFPFLHTFSPLVTEWTKLYEFNDLLSSLYLEQNSVNKTQLLELLTKIYPASKVNFLFKFILEKSLNKHYHEQLLSFIKSSIFNKKLIKTNKPFDRSCTSAVYKSYNSLFSLVQLEQSYNYQADNTLTNIDLDFNKYLWSLTSIDNLNNLSLKKNVFSSTIILNFKK